MDYQKSSRINRNNKAKDKNNSFFGSQKHIRIKMDIIEKRTKNKKDL